MSVIQSLLATVGACAILLGLCYVVGSALDRCAQNDTERAGYPVAEPPLAAAIVFDEDVTPELLNQIAASMHQRAKYLAAERRARLN